MDLEENRLQHRRHFHIDLLHQSPRERFGLHGFLNYEGFREQITVSLTPWILRTRNDESAPDFTTLLRLSQSDSSFRVRNIVTVAHEQTADD